MNRRIKVDFYRVHVQSTVPISFEAILKLVEALPQDGRTSTFNHCPVYLHEHIEEVDGALIGEMVRLRVNEPAIKGNADGTLNEIVLDEGDFLSGLTAFLYRPKERFICFERNANGVNAKNFARYMTQKSGIDGGVELNVVIDPDVLARVASMVEYRALEVSVATFEDLGTIQQDLPSVAQGIEMAKSFDAPVFSFRLSMGKSGGPGLSKKVIDAAKQLLGKKREDKDEVRSIIVEGRDEGADTTVALDLIQDRVIHTDDVPVSHVHAAWYASRRDLLLRAWDNNKAELHRLGSPK